MARFRRNADGDDSMSWRAWSRSIESDKFDGDLGLVDTEIETFGDSARHGFSQAWAERAGDDETELPAAVLEDKRSARLRDIDRRRGPLFFVGVVACLALAGVAIFWLLPQYGGSDSAAPGESGGAPADLLVAPGIARVYEDGPTLVTGSSAATLSDYFVAEAFGVDPLPTPDPSGGLPAQAAATTVLWGGRLHVAVVGAGVGEADVCAIATLLSADVEVLDLAADGGCGDRYAATGDRIACRSTSVVLLEVWPRNPSISTPQPEPATLRIRLEKQQPAGSVHSNRVTAPVDSPLEQSSVPLGGAPGAKVEISVGGFTGTCVLLDRSDVPVRLL